MTTFSGYMLFNRQIKSIKHFYSNGRRSISGKKGNNEPNLPVYTSEQQLQVLTTLQKCAVNNVTRVHLNDKRLQSLKLLFDKNPNLTSLEPLLTVNGFGPRLLQRICNSILEEPPEEVDRISDSKNIILSSSIITPPHILQCNVESVISIHLSINNISWARLWAEDGKLDTWGLLDLSHYADKKYDVHTVWKLVMQLREEIPDGDIFVMENNNWSNVANIKKPMKYHIQEAMLTTAICSIFNQSDSRSNPRSDTINRMYFLRAFTSSRLYRKIVGSERVSAQDVVQEMIDGVEDNRHRPVTFVDGTAEQYRALNGSQRDSMCHALLLVVSFTELVLLQNMAAISIIGRLSKRTGRLAA